MQRNVSEDVMEDNPMAGEANRLPPFTKTWSAWRLWGSLFFRTLEQLLDPLAIVLVERDELDTDFMPSVGH